jgi:hypothetical protein
MRTTRTTTTKRTIAGLVAFVRAHLECGLRGCMEAIRNVGFAGSNSYWQVNQIDPQLKPVEGFA